MIRLLVGDCREILPTLADESVHCVVTSPPYWGLRDYGVDGQIGLETSLGEHVETMVSMFREVRRVLRRDGTLWLNYGDCYVTSPPGNKPNTTALSSGLPNSIANQEMRRAAQVLVSKAGNDGLYNRKMDLQIGHGEDKEAIWGNKAERTGLKPKDLCGIPWRVALALQADGWWLRQDIIWSKPNPMPESVTDRCTKAHEYIFLLSKSERYYYDAAAIAEDLAESTVRIHSSPGVSVNRIGKHQKVGNGHSGLVNGDLRDGKRNKRSVWEVATAPFSEAHFATFPPALIEPCILAGCPKVGTVLDPFGGAGTTGLVADRQGRNAILIELNPEYAAMAERRIKNDSGMFASLERVTA